MSGDSPSGLPLALFAKIKAPSLQNTGDIQLSGNEVKTKNERKWTKFQRVFDQQSREKDMFEHELHRVIPLILDGYSASIFVFGTASSDKRELLTGIIHLLFDQLWLQLAKKTNSFQIQLNAVEIVEDAIFDLMNLDNHNLVIEYTDDGAQVSNLQTSTLTSSNDFQILFTDIMHNRTQQVTEFGPKADKASFILTLKITYENIHSLLQFFEFPAADKLIENPARLRMQESPDLNKELFGIANLINSFDDKSMEQPLQDCKSNMLLQETMGGNCVSFGIICLNASDSTRINSVLLEYSNKLGQIENYPVINNARIRGLLVKYYKRYHSVIRQLEALKQQHMHNVNEQSSAIGHTEAKLLEFRTSLIEKEKEMIALHGEKDKLSESYAQFREKYAELAERKQQIQKELILSEEKCLNISKTLIELQIENNSLKKNESVIRADLETKLIGAENDILETGVREQNLAQQIEQLKRDREQLLEEKKTLSIEYVALRSNYMNLNEEFDESKEEQQQLNVQLINLINANKALSESSTRLNQENEVLMKKNEELAESKENLESKCKNAETEMTRSKAVSERQGIELVKAQVELERMKTSVEATRSEYHKKWLKENKDKEMELQNIASQRTNEKQHSRAQIQQLEREVESLKGQIRVANREIVHHENQCNQYKEQIATLSKECDISRDTLKEKTQEYREKTFTFLQRVRMQTGDAELDANAANAGLSTVQIEDLKVTQNKLYQELVEQHTVREEELMSESENERKKNRKLQQYLQTLTQRFLLLQDYVKDINGDQPIPANVGISSADNNALLHDLKALSGESEQHEEQLKHKITGLERDLEKEKRAHVNTAERALTQQEAIQKELLTLKKVLKEEHSDCEPMTGKVKAEYQENLHRLKALQNTLQQQIEMNDKMQKSGMQAASQSEQMVRSLEMQLSSLRHELQSVTQENGDLNAELSELQQKLLSNANTNTSVADGTESRVKRKRRSIASISEVANDVDDSERTADGGCAGGNVDVRKYKKQIVALKKKCKETDAKYRAKLKEAQDAIRELESKISAWEASGGGGMSDGGGAMWERVKKLEREKAELIVRVKALEAENATMDKHYKLEIAKYRKKLAVRAMNKKK